MIPTISSQYPLWDEHGDAVAAPEPPEIDEHSIHMPDPSYWPLLVSVGLALAAAGLLVWKAHTIGGLTVISIGLALTLLSIYMWSFEPPVASSSEGVDTELITGSGRGHH
jgi:hypothetical protein